MTADKGTFLNPNHNRDVVQDLKQWGASGPHNYTLDASPREVWERVKEFCRDNREGSFLLCQATRAGVWQWFCKLSLTLIHKDGRVEGINPIAYSGDPDSAVEDAFKELDKQLSKV